MEHWLNSLFESYLEAKYAVDICFEKQLRMNDKRYSVWRNWAEFSRAGLLGQVGAVTKKRDVLVLTPHPNVQRKCDVDSLHRYRS
jgi:hypothetical protein